MVALTDDPALSVIMDAARAGLRMRADNGRVCVSPKGVISPALARRLRAHKTDILEALDDPETTADRIIESSQDAVDDLRECFDERIAICAIDGGVSESTAQRVALEQLFRKIALDRISMV